ncbi:penicillin-binding protein [Halostreptopolyspora alba]|uniref:Penicillin-binding protein n=1 Tax=Halostreptopolyspora alba TaxID=2487137 RepID=A0A3N0E284_9ACTN|nr:penicillin-binding protein [Nocardiopsaceae bacterium YIM 96095]
MWQHTDDPTYQREHTPDPRPWESSGENTHTTPEHTNEPTPHAWQHTDDPTYQREHTPDPRPWESSGENTHTTPEHTNEPTPHAWQHTDEGERPSWREAPPTGRFPTVSTPRETHEPGATGPPSLEDTASFAAPRHEPPSSPQPQHGPDPGHQAHVGTHSPDRPWAGDRPNVAQYGDQAPAAPSPPPGDVPGEVGTTAGAQRPYGDTDHAGPEPDRDLPSHGPYVPAEEPAGAATASHQALRPRDPGPPSQEQEELDTGDDARPRRSRKGLVVGIVSTAVVLALIGGGISWYVLALPKPEDTAESYAAAWGEGDYGAMAGLSTGGDAEQSLTRFADNLGVTGAQVDVGEVSADGDTATAPYEVTLSLKNAGDWAYEGELPLTRQDGEWLVDFSPEVMHPELGEGQTLTRVNAWGERGHILAADGTRLDTDEAGGSVGMIVGQVGAVEEEDLEDLGPAYDVGDPTGVSGLQHAYEERLAGEAGIAIHLVDEGDEEQAAQEEDPTVVDSIEGSDGEDVTTSLDPAIQSAAARAVVGENDPTALTAIRPSTGEILAVANAPGGYNRAFEGQYAPGSSFKIVSYQALLANGLGAEATMHCPEEANVGGWDFTNAGDAAYGEQSVTEAFATSCNTALVQEVANRLDSQTITAAAERFGMNSDLDVGVPTIEPSFPEPENTTMVASQSIGQGQILTSPLHMATVPAAVADGSWRSPTLVSEPEMPDQPEPTQIEHADQLRPMMREVVTNGTADEAGFTGEVHGKTGSAEFGTAEDEDDELDTHAWFVGYKGDLAFSVVVEGGGGGGSVAAPIAADFANAL